MIQRRSDLDSAVVAAVTDGDLKRVRQLLDQGASPDARDYCPYLDGPWFSNTPVLFYACDKKLDEIVALLLSRGAQPDATLSRYENMLQEEVPPLVAAFPSATLVEVLLKAGADPNEPRRQREDTSWEQSPLRLAPTEEIKELLRRYGAVE